ncbi:TetR/AcrR family transcriptional regulator [Microvirga thermotolerans]|uniref:TetR family transcriptional regulator n=1 Tax=Microvirga thermotolerans TaxID=2651334 RepID=A0A5P9JX12_9HYPH|nr:TetR/AcrR family transcriptional regulator [Microvirga thermotolerans]QFU16973.1 TetR family transcriptional regulator [Microvirga thermotolerans]
MVQKSEEGARRGRGRPRAYDPDTALRQAREAFWVAGYSGTSLDDIAAATGMNRPSLYAAFGDKHSLYLHALNLYWTEGLAAMRRALSDERPLAEELMEVYDRSLAIYFSGEGPPRGCFAIGTATTEAVQDAEIRARFAEGLKVLDRAFEDRIRLAQEGGEIPRGADAAALAAVASSTLHTLAIRARMGTPREELRELARKSVAVICGS